MPIEVRKVSAGYAGDGAHEIRALNNLSFEVADGEFVGIMGQTGCGKSTLLQLLAGLMEPSGGRIFIDGEDINAPGYDRSVLRRTVGMVFQYPEYQLFETTVERDVAFALKHSGFSREEMAERSKWALELLGFSYEKVQKLSPLSLSGGEKRRVAIAGVLAVRPRILLFDETLAGLDPCGRQEFLELIAALNREGITVLMVSHDADCLCEYADRILVLKNGELAADGTPREVFGDMALARSLHIGGGNVRKIAQSLYERGILSSPQITKYGDLVKALADARSTGGRALEPGTVQPADKSSGEPEPLRREGEHL